MGFLALRNQRKMSRKALGGEWEDQLGAWEKKQEDHKMQEKPCFQEDRVNNGVKWGGQLRKKEVKGGKGWTREGQKRPQHAGSRSFCRAQYQRAQRMETRLRGFHGVSDG